LIINAHPRIKLILKGRLMNRERVLGVSMLAFIFGFDSNETWNDAHATLMLRS
jgi:hypothetical protein